MYDCVGICDCDGVSLIRSIGSIATDVILISGNVGGWCLRSMRLVLNHVLVTESVEVINVVEIINELLKVDLYTYVR
jgi:hypothetical protein